MSSDLFLQANIAEANLPNNTDDLEATFVEDELPRLNEYSDQIKERLVDPSTPIPPPEDIFLLKKGNTYCIPKGDVVVITGKAKNGKTQLINIWITALCRGAFLGFKAIRKKRILYIDCEQNKVNTAKFMRKVYKHCGWEKEQSQNQFQAINLRGDNYMERRDFTEKAIREGSYEVIFIDGVKDLLQDINNPTQCSDVLEFLLQLTKDYGCTIFCVLHENKGDTNLRGHIGTELLNKSAEVWKVKKSGNIFEVEQTECRNEPCNGFGFYINQDTGLLEGAEPAKKISREKQTKIKLFENMKASLPPLSSLKYTELKDTYSEVAGVTEKTAERHITKAVKEGYISKGSDERYRLSSSPFP